MNKKKFDTRLACEIHSKKLFFFSAVAMLFSNILLAMFVLSADTSEKTIIVPVGFDKPFYVKSGEIDPVYAEQVTRYIAQLRWTYTPKTVANNFDSILSMVMPSQYAQLKSMWGREILKVQRNQLSAVFNPDAFRIDRNNNEAVIRGDFVAYMGTQIVSKRKRYLKVGYKYKDGRFNISAMKELKGVSFDDLSDAEKEDKDSFEKLDESIEVSDDVEMMSEVKTISPVISDDRSNEEYIKR